MTDPLFVQTDGVLNYAKRHSQVVSGLSGLNGPDGTGVRNSHGAIASAVSGALHTALDGRSGTLGATSRSASVLADLLRKAAQAYAAGDEEGGSRLQAAAAALEGEDGSDRSGAGVSGGGVSGGGVSGTSTAGGVTGAPGADPMAQMGQIMGQVGQQIGQFAQLITAPLQGLAQGLQQVPQQIMQGVQQASQAAQAAALRDTELTGSEEPAEEPEDEPEREDRAERPDPVPVPEARPGSDVPSERAPVAAVDAPRPAPTRPQVG